ncbi:hypothetical protein E4U42_001568 [Claviceps africana]|uniref:Uncharacterized protein n=1 Tax=Claviceps africana TaxID=83212 RepID=A0A8K0NK99_9HYPO|nr:hypothetical protein E4U42_001568 [Claviceps africana]
MAKAVISSAMRTYRADTRTGAPDADAAQTALGMLTKLRGVGPATASLLLSVHDPRRVIFFSDEAYWWLCCGGNSGVRIRYTAGEYRSLRDEAGVLVRRLGEGTHMVDVEKAAYVAMRTGGEMEGKTGKEAEDAEEGMPGGKARASRGGRAQSAKRKVDGVDEDAPLRRSRRLNRRGTGP